jgi:hypothetical protein
MGRLTQKLLSQQHSGIYCCCECLDSASEGENTYANCPGQ